MQRGLSIPHGGRLVSRFAPDSEKEHWEGRKPRLKKIVLNARELSDVEMIAIGAFSPLTGFMPEGDYRRVVKEMRLANGLVWSLPITLTVTKDKAGELQPGEDIALTDEQGTLIAILHLKEKYVYDKKREAQDVYRTNDEKHPGVAYLYGQGDVLLGGEISLINRPRHNDFIKYRLDPVATRQLFQKYGWKKVVGFQTRNPIHRAHEYIQKTALEIVDGLFLHPLVGETKKDDVPAEIRMRCYEVLLAGYYPEHRVVLAVNPAAMRYAGPREAIFHALIRKNYGCTHFIVGRDHAGVGSFYGHYDAQIIFEEFSPEDLGITPMFFENTFYCQHCGNMASLKTCPHPPAEHLSLSGTKVREMLEKGEDLPKEFSRPEVAEVLREAYAGKK